jgi:hypothetical protein
MFPNVTVSSASTYWLSPSLADGGEGFGDLASGLGPYEWLWVLHRGHLMIVFAALAISRWIEARTGRMALADGTLAGTSG